MRFVTSVASACGLVATRYNSPTDDMRVTCLGSARIRRGCGGDPVDRHVGIGISTAGSAISRARESSRRDC